MKIILLGAPGSGKGTQSSLIEEKFNIPKISTGDMLRQAIKDKTKIGSQVAQIIASGQLVSDEVVIDLLKERLSKPDCKNGYILDGFPRTATQAKSLANNNIDINFIIELKADKEEIIKRISGRRIHKESGRTYHIKYNPPKQEGLDDITQEKLITRKDDEKETVINRIKIYEQESAQMINYYKEINQKIIQIDGNKTAQEINSEINSIIKKSTK